jgi:hypothetical protein
VVQLGWEFSSVIYPGSTPVGNATLVVANVLTCNKYSQKKPSANMQPNMFVPRYPPPPTHTHLASPAFPVPPGHTSSHSSTQQPPRRHSLSWRSESAPGGSASTPSSKQRRTAAPLTFTPMAHTSSHASSPSQRSHNLTAMQQQQRRRRRRLQRPQLAAVTPAAWQILCRWLVVRTPLRCAACLRPCCSW